MADTAYDADHLRKAIADEDGRHSQQPSRVLKYLLDKHLYARRHPV
jgi:transposase